MAEKIPKIPCVHKRGTTVITYLKLKEARDKIPEIDGTSQAKLKEFLSACNYATKSINPAEERTLLEAILCTKLKGKAMLDFETRDIRSFPQLKRGNMLSKQKKHSLTTRI